ncbi:transcriptional regulator [Candidatus Binatia bacterium]|nr:transcriptional regulator [Candidatus Binatia bacterium]
MTKTADRILLGLQDALAFAQGKAGRRREHRVLVAPRVDVKGIRARLQMTQAEFANTFGFTLHAVRHWEQGTRTPEGPARVLLTVIAQEPGAVVRALRRTAA